MFQHGQFLFCHDRIINGVGACGFKMGSLSFSGPGTAQMHHSWKNGRMGNAADLLASYIRIDLRSSPDAEIQL